MLQLYDHDNCCRAFTFLETVCAI